MKKKIIPITWTPKKVAIKSIKPTPKNFKIKTDLGKQRLEKSLELFGIAGTVILNTDYTLIDGNSRIEQEKEKGNKFVWASLPSRKLTPKEFEEMAAMYDFAIAGEVDEERIKGDLGKTADFFKKWNMPVPDTLESMGAKADVKNLPTKGTGKGSKDNTKVPGQTGEEEMQITLFFTPRQEKEFRRMETALQEVYFTENTTDTVWEAMKVALGDQKIKLNKKNEVHGKQTKNSKRNSSGNVKGKKK